MGVGVVSTAFSCSEGILANHLLKGTSQKGRPNSLLYLNF